MREKDSAHDSVVAQNLLEHFTVDSGNTRVALITFSTSVTVDINDLEPGTETDAETKCTLYARLDRIVSSHTPHGYTATHDALQVATQVSARSLANVLFTPPTQTRQDLSLIHI